MRQKNDTTYFEQMACRRSRMFDAWADPKYFILSNCISAKPHFSKYFNTRIYALTRFVVAGILMKRKKHINVKNGTLYSNFSPVKEIIHIINYSRYCNPISLSISCILHIESTNFELNTSFYLPQIEAFLRRCSAQLHYVMEWVGGSWLHPLPTFKDHVESTQNNVGKFSEIRLCWPIEIHTPHSI